jgi:hypothetical protein
VSSRPTDRTDFSAVRLVVVSAGKSAIILVCAHWSLVFSLLVCTVVPPYVAPNDHPFVSRPRAVLELWSTGTLVPPPSSIRVYRRTAHGPCVAHTHAWLTVDSRTHTLLTECVPQ